MAKVPRSRVRGIAIFVVFVALAWAALTTDRKTDTELNVTQILREPDARWRDTGSVNKSRIRITAPNINEALSKTGTLVNEYSVPGQPAVLRSIESNYGIFIFKVPRARLGDLQQELVKLGTISEFKETVDTALVKKNISTESYYLESKKAELAGLASTPSNYGDISTHRNRLQDEIRKLENTVEVLRQSDSSLLYLQLMPVAGKNVSYLNRLGIRFLLALAAMFVGIIILYYGTRLLIYLLTLMGVKGLPTTGLGGSNYGYGNYSHRYYNRYGYGSGKRKVKRIYKGQPTTPAEGDGNKPESQGK